MNLGNDNFGMKGFDAPLGNQDPQIFQAPQISSLDLTKGGSRRLTSLNTNKPIDSIALGLGWKTVPGVDIDLDASVLLLSEVNNNAYGEVKYQVVNPEKDVIYFHQPNTNCGVVHDGDSRSGNSGKDDESISIKLNEVPLHIKKIVAVITIDECIANKQNFAMVQEAHIRVDDMSKGTPKVLVNYKINEQFKYETSLIVAELVRNNQGSWDFKALGEGRHTDISGLFWEFGVR